MSHFAMKILVHGKGMDDPAQGMAKFVKGTLWRQRHLHGSIVDRFDDPAVLEPKAEG